MARRFVFSLFSSVMVALLAPIAPALAQEVPPEIENARNAAVGHINADAVYVRSGAGDNYYPTMKLNTGTEVTVVGVKFDWLKILPPEGSFCYIAKAFVDKTGADAGTVNRDDVNVRAGSGLNAMKTTVMGKLSTGNTVRILGEQDEYYKIAPPPESFVYVKKDFVTAVKAMPQVAGANEPVTGEKKEVVGQSPTTPADTGAATTQPAGAPAEVTAAPATQPVATAEIEFDKLEAEFTTSSNRKIEEQPVAQLLGDYQKLIADPQLPESMRRIADFRVQQLKARSEAQQQFAEVMKSQVEAKKRQDALQAEQQEIQQQIKKTEVQVFAAVGELRTSSIQKGEQALYRLTDPQNGRTVCYVASDDPKYGGEIGKFIGVRGEIVTDPQLMLKVIKATEYSIVDPNQVYRGIAPQIVPPSLLPAGSSNSAQQASATEK